MLNAGLQPVREDDEVAPLNSYLRWLPCCYNPGQDRRRWYTQLMRSEEHTSELQSLMRISYAVFCLKKKSHIIVDDRGCDARCVCNYQRIQDPFYHST